MNQIQTSLNVSRQNPNAILKQKPIQFPIHQPVKYHSLSPVKTIPTYNNPNQNQTRVFQSPQPKIIQHPFQSSSQHQHISLTKQMHNQSLYGPSLNHMQQSIPSSVNYLNQNSNTLISHTHSKLLKAGTPVIQNNRVNHFAVSSSPGITFSYQKQISSSSNPVLVNHAQVFEKPMFISQNHTLQSAVNINLNNNNNKMEVFYKPVQIIETQSHTSPGIIHNIDKIETHIQSKQNPLFHMTNSYNVNSNQHFLNNQVIQSAQTSAVPGFQAQNLPQQPKRIQQTSQNFTQNEEQISSNPIWEQRFIMIYQKFEWFYERFEFISREFQILSQEFENVNSQDEWLQLKEKHDLLLQKIQQIQEQLVNTIHQNQELAEQYELQNRNSKESDQVERVWEHRYHELLEQYKSLSQNYADLQSQGNNQNISQSQHSQSKTGMTIQEQAEMQSKFHELQNEYNVLCDEYQKIRLEYERIYQENTHYNKENTELMAAQQQASNMASQLQAYVQELQQQNDQLRKQERKSTPSQQQNYVPRQEVEKMQYHFGQQIEKYEQELQKYRMALQQYQQKTQLNQQQLQKISEIAMERQNKIKQLQASQINNNSKSGHSNTYNSQNQNQDLQKRYVNILQQDVRLWREKETDFFHKIQIKDMERRSMEQKINYLEKQLDLKNMELERLGNNLNEKLAKIQQNTTTQVRAHQKFPGIFEQEASKQMVRSPQQVQILDLQTQLHELQNVLNSKMTFYRQLQQSIKGYEERLINQSNAQSVSEIEFQKKISEIQIHTAKTIAQKEMTITLLNSQLQRLQQAYEMVNKQKANARQSLKIQFQQAERQINARHTSRVLQLQKKIQQKSYELIYVKQIVQKYEHQIKTKNQQLTQLRNFLQIKKSPSTPNSISPSRNDYQLLRDELKVKEEVLERKNQELSKLKREKQFKVKHIHQLEHQLESSNSELNKKINEISSQKRLLNQMNSLEADYEDLKATQNKKNIEINQLKQQLFQTENLKMSNESLRRELERVLQQKRDKYGQIQKLKEQNYQLERKINQIINSRQTSGINTTQNPTSYLNYQTTKDESETSQLRQLIRKKDKQISKTNQAIQQIQYLLQNRTRQLQMQKSQLANLSRSKESQVSSLSHNICSLEVRLKDSESKRNKLNEQVSQLRVKFQQQLKSQSERQKAYYDKVITRYDEDYKCLKQKLRTEQQTTNKMELQLEKSKSSQKNLQIQVKQLNKKINNHQSQLLQKQQIYSTFRQKMTQSQHSTKALYEKLSSLELQLKTKQQQIKLSEEKNTILQQKMKKNKKDYENFRSKLIVSQQYENNNSVVEYLSKRIAQYESKMINQSERDFGFKVKDQQANHVFENQVVYHLKLENQMLRKQLQGKGIQYDRKVLNQLEQQNLKRSKILIKNSAFSSKLGNMSSNLLVKDNNEDINFYKEKNKQLEQRVEKHLKYNRELKQRIESLIKGSSQPKQIDYYKQQIAEYQLKIGQLQKKLQALTEQNKNITKGIQKRQSRVEQHYEDRIKQLQSRILQMNKTIQQLNQQNRDLQIAKSQAQMQKVTLNQQIKRLNQKISSLHNAKHQQYQNQTTQLKSKTQQYESEITKLTNKTRILQEQIKRLNQTNNSNKLSLTQLTNLKSKIQQLTNSMAKTERQLHEEQAKSHALANEVASLHLKCRTWESETQRLKDMNELYAKKQRNDLSQSTVLKQSTSGLQSQVSNLQNELLTVNSRKYQLETQMSALVEQLRHYQALIPTLQYDLEFIRSDTLVEQALIEEMVLGADNTAECIDGLRANVQRKIYWFDQIFNKIKNV